MNIRKEWASQDSLTNGYSQFYSVEETVDEVKENFNIRRYHSAEGYNINIINDLTNIIRINEQSLIQSHSNPINQDKEDKKIHLPIETEFQRGSIIEWLYRDESWIVFSNVDDLLAYKSAQIYRCNHVLKWLNPEGQLQEQYCVKENYLKLNDGIKSNTNMILGDGEFKLFLQDNPETKKLERDKRFIWDEKAYKISFVDRNTDEGLCLLTLKEDQINEQYDDILNGVANAFGYPTYIIEFTTSTIELSESGTYQLEWVVKLDGNIVTDKSVIFTSDDTNIATIDEDGLVTAIADGDCIITASLSGNSSVYDTVSIEVSSTPSDVVVEEISGSNSITNGLTGTYEIYKVVNNVQQADTYVWSIIGSGASINSYTGNTVIVKANTSGVSITLRAVNNITSDVIEKQITLVGMW